VAQAGAQEDPEALETLESLTRVLIAQKKFSEAEQALSDALTPAFVKQPSSASILVLRADLKGRRGEWKEAATDAALAFEHQPSDHERWSVLAAFLAKTHDLPGYEQLCRRILKSCARTTNPYVADQAAKTCLLVPSTEVDLQLVNGLADRAVTLGAKDEGALPFYHVCKALAEYRLGHFANAVEWASRTLGASRASAHGRACAVLAMAHWRLGEKEAALNMLAKGEALAPRVLPKKDAENPGKNWQTWLFARMALDEAAKLIESPSPDATKAERE
jgi:tetratricopeptide (TPR) repeat protein